MNNIHLLLLDLKKLFSLLTITREINYNRDYAKEYNGKFFYIRNYVNFSKNKISNESNGLELQINYGEFTVYNLVSEEILNFTSNNTIRINNFDIDYNLEDELDDTQLVLTYGRQIIIEPDLLNEMRSFIEQYIQDNKTNRRNN